MPAYLSNQGEPFLAFEGGIDRENARTFLDRTLYGAYSLYYAYEDAQNILLTSPTSGKHPITINGDEYLDPLVAWPDPSTPGNPATAAPIHWFAPFTYSTFDSTNGLVFSTHLIRAQTNGAVGRYDSGAPGTNTLLRRGMNLQNHLWTHLTYDQWLVTFNGRDAPMKYGQHLSYENQNETRPSYIPLGAKLVSPMVNVAYQTAGEAWTIQPGSGFVPDASVPGGGSRLGPESLQLAPNTSASITYTASLHGSSASFTSRNFLSPPQPYSQSAPNFAGSDYFVFQYYKAAVGTNKNIVVTFANDTTPTNYFQFTITPTIFGQWARVAILRSAAASSGSPDWTTINYVLFSNLETGAGSQTVYLDDPYFLYSAAPPPAQVGEQFLDRIVVGGVPTSAATLATLYWSNALAPDFFPGSNAQPMTSSTDTMARTNQINGLKEFANTVIVGMPNAIIAWTIGTDGLATKTTIATEIGIDAHRAIIEIPSGALLFPWQRGIYSLRATGRQYASAKIAPLLANVDLINSQWTVGVADERTKTVRFWFRTAGNTSGATGATPAFNTLGIVFDPVRAQERGEPVWPSTMTQMADFAVTAYVNGSREVLYCQFNGPNIVRLGSNATSAPLNPGGLLTSYVTLPWMARVGRDRVTKWIGLTLPLANTVPVQVQIRYASNPGEFDNAVFKTVDVIPPVNAVPGPNTLTQEARVNFGGSTRWAQVRFLATAIGFEIFPPVELVGLVTERSP